MKTDDPTIAELQQKVTAAQQEFDLAVAFHEVWKPTAYDEDLHGRLGVSYATQAFRVIRTALRRELILALTRLWDKDGRAIGMECIAKALGKKKSHRRLGFGASRSKLRTLRSNPSRS